MVIDTSHGVNINSFNSIDINYIRNDLNTVKEKTKLNVNGLTYSKDICIYDYMSKSKKHLTDMFVRREGLTLNPNQIYSGSFNGDFDFNGDIKVISNIETSSLKINDVTELHGERFSVFAPSFFNEKTI